MQLREAQELAEQLMDEYGLTAQGWTFAFDRAVRRFGQCIYGSKRITLSRHLTELNTPADVENTIRHEIAHALAGRGAGHGPLWKAQAIAVGCSPSRCYDSAVVQAPPPKYVGECPGCGAQYPRHRRLRVSCGVCSPGKYDARYRLSWKQVYPG